MPDAYLIMSYGGPNGPDDVVPFLKNATKGRGIPEERLAVVGQHYFLFGGKSPINELNAQLAEALRRELAIRGDTTPVEVANRNWHPFGEDVLRDMYERGIRRVRAIPTAAYGSYSSCRQYAEDIDRWVAAVGHPDLVVDKVRPFWNTSGFCRAYREVIAAALRGAPADWRIVFVTHSIPTAMDQASGTRQDLTYREQHLALIGRIAADLGIEEWDLAFCSRSGNPRTPWLEPDINDHLEELAARGVPGVVMIPVGFISDHMEVKYDLDTQATQTARELGIGSLRVPTLDGSRVFVSQIADLLQGGSTEPCPPGCCPSGATHPYGNGHPGGHPSGHPGAQSAASARPADPGKPRAEASTGRPGPSMNAADGVVGHHSN